MSVAEKEDEGVLKGGEAKEKDEKNEAKAIQENKISEDVKERVVKIDQNPNFVEENSELNKNEKKNDVERQDVSSCNVNVSRLSFKEESNLFSDLKENEKKALVELRSKVEEAISENQLFKAKENDIKEQNKEKSSENAEKEMEKPKENEGREDDKDEGSKANSSIDEPEKEKNIGQESEEKNLKSVKDDMAEERDVMQEGVEKERVIAEAEKKKMLEAIEGKEDCIDKDIKLWGVPLSPSKGWNATDAVLLKFLRARDFKVIDAFEMLRNTLQWRKENNMDSILDEDLGNEFHSTAYLNGSDRQGHPVCYNVFGVLSDEEMYNKTLGTEENREKFLRWRLQLMEEGIEKLDFYGGVSSLLQISDLKNTPGPSKKEVRLIMKQVVGLLQDNYPEFVVKNIFINVPFWYYAFAALLSPFLTQRTKSKFVYARPAKVTETLLKYIDAEEIPVSYGGLKRDNDSDFSTEDHAEEILVKASSTETIEIPAPEAGSVLIWDLIVLGWEVSYKEEFIPHDEKSYTVIVQKEKKMGIQESSIRNSFRNNEPGKIVLIIGNAAFKTKKRAFYRFKIKNDSSST
ncbi:patellin-4-like [Durio zibethinus]|uniref:Patellin-4-like n=1 Tax=Durio zibethinus TaxID=66656 RepID=A0A6P5ZFQ2_DURZI|nr:patellin-4-like [Durio zibethinus]